MDAKQMTQTKVNILCLHGMRQTKELFRTRLGRLVPKLRKIANLHFIDAPFELPLRDTDTVATRTWILKGSPKERDSFCQTMGFLETVWNSALHRGQEHASKATAGSINFSFDGGFQGVLGFSMGSAIVSAMLNDSERFPGLAFGILFSAPFYKHIFENSSSRKIAIPNLHVFGATDRVVLPSASQVLAEQHFKDPTLYLHKLGHCVPSKSADHAVVIDFVSRVLQQSKETETKVGMSHEGLSEKVKNLSYSSNVTKHVSDIESKKALIIEQAEKKANAKHVIENEDIGLLQYEELEALFAIYPDVSVSIENNALTEEKLMALQGFGKGDTCPALRIKLKAEESPMFQQVTAAQLELTILFTGNYPETLPVLALSHRLDMTTFPMAMEKQLLEHLRSIAKGSIGTPMVFNLISEADDWLARSPKSLLALEVGPDGDESSEPVLVGSSDPQSKEPVSELLDMHGISDTKEAEIIEAATNAAASYRLHSQKSSESNSSDEPARDQQSSFKGKFVVGLVGKPSAGKSTFFNCITKLQTKAKVGAHPFTTIEPNFGTGWWASNDPEDIISEALQGQFPTEYGRDARGRRLLPLFIKDVAGLIPGAYKGLGKGNKFLNDLVDADVLVHIVDVSGSSDKNGVQVEAATDTTTLHKGPVDDVKWIHEELHRWIFYNILNKWRSVFRLSRHSPASARERLYELFTGYQKNTRAFVDAALSRAALNIENLEEWTRADLHLLIAHFLSIRFPICLALNKFDKFIATHQKKCMSQGQNKWESTVTAEVKQLQEQLLSIGYPSVFCSAALESQLLQSSGSQYRFGDVQLPEQAVDLTDGGLQSTLTAAKSVMQINEHLGLGVLEAVSKAVALTNPLLIYPEIEKRGTGSETLPTLAGFMCLQMRQHSTIYDVYNRLMHLSNSHKQAGPQLREPEPPTTNDPGRPHAVQKKAPLKLLFDGDFVRAEVVRLKEARKLEPCAKIRVVGREFRMTREHSVARIFTNKKVAWQRNVQPAS